MAVLDGIHICIWCDTEVCVDRLTCDRHTDPAHRTLCRRCERSFTESEWFDRHTDLDDGVSDIHARCCACSF